MSGFIPDSVGNLSEIRAFSIMGNRGLASSTIPAAIGNLNALRELSIPSCGLIGRIPNTIGNCRHLTLLDLSGNDLSSTLPPELSNAASLTILRAERNRLSGTIPFTYQGLLALKIVQLDSNEFESPLPNFGNMSNLETLSLASNSFRGTLPDVFCSRSGLIPPLLILVLSNNFFEGTLPTNFYRLNALSILDLSNNSFSGVLASHISGLTSLYYLLISSNKFEGTLPDMFCSATPTLIKINLRSNRLEGTLPSSLAQCSAYLKEIDLSDNRFSGSIPAAWGQLTLLASLNLSFNALSGTISSSKLFLLPNLLTVNLRSNAFSGLLPRFDSSPLLLDLDMSSNLFHGPLDLFGANVGSSINIVNLSNNFLTGIIQPKSVIVRSASMSLLDISLNDFDCPYPLFRTNLLLQRSPCSHPWTFYATYLGYAIAIAVVLGVAFLYSTQIKRSVDAIRASFAARPMTLFMISWCVACVSLGIDIRSCVEMFQYLNQNVDFCAFVNEAAIYVPLMPPLINSIHSFADAVFSECFSEPRPKILPPFAFIVTKCLQPKFDPTPPAYSPLAIQAVATVCNGIRGCSFVDSPDYSCVLAHPELAEFGGIEFSRFLTCVIIAMSLRLLVECCRGVCVAVSCWHRSTAWHSSIGDIISSSPLVVLLLATMPREKFVAEVAARDSTYHDLLRRLIHGVALGSLPILFVNVYFAMRITQTGLSSVTLLSTLYGAITIPALLVRAFLGWRRQRQSFTSNVDPESNANRETNFDMLELTEPTSTSGESNEIVHGSDTATDTVDTPDNPYFSF